MTRLSIYTTGLVRAQLHAERHPSIPLADGLGSILEPRIGSGDLAQLRQLFPDHAHVIRNGAAGLAYSLPAGDHTFGQGDASFRRHSQERGADAGGGQWA